MFAGNCVYANCTKRNKPQLDNNSSIYIVLGKIIEISRYEMIENHKRNARSAFTVQPANYAINLTEFTSSILLHYHPKCLNLIKYNANRVLHVYTSHTINFTHSLTIRLSLCTRCSLHIFLMLSATT